MSKRFVLPGHQRKANAAPSIRGSHIPVVSTSSGMKIVIRSSNPFFQCINVPVPEVSVQDIASSVMTQIEAATPTVELRPAACNFLPGVTAGEHFADHIPSPVTQRERIATIDIVRGVAL